MGGLLFYFLLSSFTWMALQGVAMYIIAVSVFDTTSSCLKYIFFLLGYGKKLHNLYLKINSIVSSGFPGIIVGVTAEFDHTALRSEN